METLDTELPVMIELKVHQAGRTFRAYLTPALTPNCPLLVILHGHGYVAEPAKFKSPSWNVLCPMDEFGEENKGSWYLGENGNYFWIEAMRKIIEEARKIVGSGRLHFWGSSMGGYGSLVHGTLNNAFAIYANTPQTFLLGSSYSEGGVKKFFKPIFGNDVDSEYNDLKKFFKDRSSRRYFLCFNQLESSNYLSEQCLPFIQHLHSLRQKFYLEIRPLEVHGKNHSISETIELFKKYP